MPLLEKLCQLAAKAESVEGTAETRAGADVVTVKNFKFDPNVEMDKRDMVSSSLSGWGFVSGARSAKIEFDLELKGSGTPETPPALGKFLKCCGFSETIDPASPESVTYQPASSGVSSMTLAGYIDGIIQKIWGARGDVSLDLTAGKIGLLHFVFTGADFSEVDGALLSSGVSYETTVPPAFLSALFTIDSLSPVFSKLAIKMGNSVVLRPDGNAASGNKSAVITGREPGLSFDPETALMAICDFSTKLKANNLATFTTTIGSTVGNIITITAPKVQYTSVKSASRNGYLSKGIDCSLNRNAGNDELVITFT